MLPAANCHSRWCGCVYDELSGQHHHETNEVLHIFSTIKHPISLCVTLWNCWQGQQARQAVRPLKELLTCWWSLFEMALEIWDGHEAVGSLIFKPGPPATLRLGRFPVFWGRPAQTHPSWEAPIARLSPLAQQVTGGQRSNSWSQVSTSGQSFCQPTNFVPKSTSQHFSPKFNELHPDSAAGRLASLCSAHGQDPRNPPSAAARAAAGAAARAAAGGG